MFYDPSFACMNGGRNRRKCECGDVKGAGHPGVQSECAGTTCFRRLVQKDSCFEHEELRHVFQRVWKCSSTYSARNEKRRSWQWLLVFLMGAHQSSYVPSRMCAKASFLDNNQEQQAKCECFSARITVRTRKTHTNQVALCFWCAVPLRTRPHTYQLRSAPSCIHLELHIKGSVRLFSTHCETMGKISQNPLSCLYS